MKRVAFIVAVVAGAAIVFFTCGGPAMVSEIMTALNA